MPAGRPVQPGSSTTERGLPEVSGAMTGFQGIRARCTVEMPA